MLYNTDVYIHPTIQKGHIEHFELYSKKFFIAILNFTTLNFIEKAWNKTQSSL